LQIIPVGKIDWDIEFIKGQENPEIQGWYSEEYNKYEPNTATIYSTGIESDQVFVWLLIPFESNAPSFKINKYSSDADRITLQLTEPGIGKWDLRIPFTDSSGAEMVFDQKP
jgi:hypothetical protein